MGWLLLDLLVAIIVAVVLFANFGLHVWTVAAVLTVVYLAPNLDKRITLGLLVVTVITYFLQV